MWSVNRLIAHLQYVHQSATAHQLHEWQLITSDDSEYWYKQEVQRFSALRTLAYHYLHGVVTIIPGGAGLGVPRTPSAWIWRLSIIGLYHDMDSEECGAVMPFAMKDWDLT